MSMSFATDQYFYIGYKNLRLGKPCQDYATSGAGYGVAYAIVSDGCSTGGETDIGSRVLALSTAKIIREHWLTKRLISHDVTPLEINLRQQVMIAGTKVILGLRSDDLLATCVYAYVSTDGGFIHMQGDGAIALCYRDSSMVITRLDWKDNTPFYPEYSGARLQSFLKAHGNDLEAIRLHEETWKCCKGDDDFSIVSCEGYSLGAGVQGITKVISCESLEDIEYIVLFSDGVTQVDGVEWKGAVKMFTDFKGTGDFAKRIITKSIKIACKTGKGPMDDISCAVICVEKDQEEA